MIKRLLLFLSALVVTAGLASRLRGGSSIRVSGIAQPTVTPIAAAFDETVETRELTLGSCVWYAIQTGIFSTEEAASERAEAYSDRGAPGLVVRDGAKWRVLIACYADKADASAVRKKLLEMQKVDTYLYPWNAEEVTLRLTGMAGQLDLAEAGLGMALSAAERLRDQAAALDSGEVTAEEALAIVEDIRRQYAVFADTVAKRFPKPYPDLIALEVSQGEQYAAMAAGLRAQADEGATALSGAMKCCAMRMYQLAVSMRQELAAL